MTGNDASPLRLRVPAALDAEVRPPGSKSLTNRALLLAALARGTTRLSGLLIADDTRRMRTCLGDSESQYSRRLRRRSR